MPIRLLVSIAISALIFEGWALGRADQAAAGPKSVGLSIVEEGDPGGTPVAEVRGFKPQGRPWFGASALIDSLPCPGKYRLAAEQEDQETGDVTAFKATLIVKDFVPRPASTPCGHALPGGPGEAVLSLAAEEGDLLQRDLFGLRLHRRAGVRFSGKLRLAGYPRCGLVYLLSGRFELGGSTGSFRSHCLISNSSVTESGRRRAGPGC
jgi:hypothetical protein